MFLNDSTYENEDGNRINRENIDCVGTYEYLSDGFFNWKCGNCKLKEGGARAYKISGIVFTCKYCNNKNLLVRTDMEFVNVCVSTYLEG